MLSFREEYLADLNSRSSWESEAEAIKIAVLMANNNGFTVYKSFFTNYEEHTFQLILGYLNNIFSDSSVTSVTSHLEEETGRRSIVVDWSSTVNVITVEAPNMEEQNERIKN
jgi:hypothetical protein